jgi:2'-5' RNA ligase
LSQGSLFGEPSSKPTDRYFLAIFPPAEIGDQLAALGTKLRGDLGLKGRVQATSRLHITTHHLGDYTEERPDIVARASEAAARLSVKPFDVTFTSAASFSGRPGNKPFVLRGTDGVKEVEAFQAALNEELKKSGLAKWAKPYTPHITLLYDGEQIPEQAIAPVTWTVTEFALVRSLLGQTQHIVLSTWPLRA